MRLTKTVDVEFDVDLDDFDTSELIEQVERWGFVVMDKDESDTPDNLKDKIHMLKEDFINWHQFGMKNEDFENILKEFFKDTIDEYIM